jgi:hypothetical protein
MDFSWGNDDFFIAVIETNVAPTGSIVPLYSVVYSASDKNGARVALA